MARVTADDIPASVTSLCTTGPWIIPKSPNEAAHVLAHYWPEIEQHIRHQIAAEFIRLGKTKPTFTWGEAALIARGEM